MISCWHYHLFINENNLLIYQFVNVQKLSDDSICDFCILYLWNCCDYYNGNIEEVKARLFADDVKIYASVVNDTHNIKLQPAVNTLVESAKSWELSISVSKLCVLNIGEVRHKRNFTISDTVLSNTSSCRDFGITASHDL
jgi:hypothetical protein